MKFSDDDAPLTFAIRPLRVLLTSGSPREGTRGRCSVDGAGHRVIQPFRGAHRRFPCSGRVAMPRGGSRTSAGPHGG